MIEKLWMSGEKRHPERQTAERAPAGPLGRVRAHEAGEDRGEPRHRVDHRPVRDVREHEAREHERDAAQARGESSETELPREQVCEAARHCVVQEMVILQDDVRDVLPALQKAQHQQIQRIEQVQVGLQEHRVVRTTPEERRARPERRVPERQDPALELMVEVGLHRETEVAPEVKPRPRERRDDRPELDGRQRGEARDRQSLTHPQTVPAHSDRVVLSQSARVA